MIVVISSNSTNLEKVTDYKVFYFPLITLWPLLFLLGKTIQGLNDYIVNRNLENPTCAKYVWNSEYLNNLKKREVEKVTFVIANKDKWLH